MAMKRLLKTKQFNAGKRPSEHHISEESFAVDHGGAIPPNVLLISNTSANDPYQEYCRENEIEFHPARMPVDLPEFFINFLTDADDIILDPFGGSNTTGAAAEKLKRYWVAVEPTAHYIEGSLGRFNQDQIQIIDKDLLRTRDEVES